ncbi:MAG: MaoC family dehydratase N-terminal domain-containing protein [Pararhodobacter sp.]|nr:MaoC family dehydratase N-terminal domain-containing protein [Pararhodobacter sp.]
MALRAVFDHPIPDAVLDYGPRDTTFYALSLGLGDEALPFVYEGAPGGMRALPGMGLVLADPGFWMRDMALDLPRLVHLAERLELERPIPPRGRLHRQTRVTHVADRGAGRGALLVADSVLSDAADGGMIARLRQTVLARGDGGSGESHGPAPERSAIAIPERAPDAVIDRPTLRQQALLYRWNGDLNPLHADPAVARAAGFERPILHGLCTMGIASLAVMEAFGDWRADAITMMEARFSAPVFPGETLRCAMWREGARVLLRASVCERGVAALDPALFILKT